MSEIVDQHHNNKGSGIINRPHLIRYNFMCDDCGEAFSSLDEYVEHYKRYHPKSIGTAIT
jgi:hypothetical protein